MRCGRAGPGDWLVVDGRRQSPLLLQLVSRFLHTAAATVPGLQAPDAVLLSFAPVFRSFTASRFVESLSLGARMPAGKYRRRG